MRLAQTQNIVCIAEMADGKLYMAKSRGEGHHRRLRRLGRGDKNEKQEQSEERHMAQTDTARSHADPGQGRRADRDQDADLARDGKGQRKDAAGKVVPRKIINKFTATFNGKRCSRPTGIRPISANPYQSFFYKAPESGEFTFTWKDDDGSDLRPSKRSTIG